ncbi:hypothetical protein BaRGS_00024887 [Batillaria attramentaria]|uniref:Uncharacterized protein n=1 Tax=Batillaria attramentaria TaxID=370345 RepID=A0ABD0K9V9_9CAEN
MGCWLSQNQNEGDDLIADVEKLIADYAWTKFQQTSGRLQRLCMRRKDYTIEVPMNYFHFEEITPPNVEAMGEQLQMTKHAAAKSSSKDTYEFRFEKTRKASLTVTYQKGFSIGGKANFSLDLVYVPGLHIEGRYEVQNSTGQTFEDTQTTSVKSDVTVDKRSARTAVVVLEERRIHAKFQVTVKMTMPGGKAVVYIKNKHGERVSTRQIQNLIPVFNKKYATEQHEGKAAEFVVQGIMEGSLPASHQICLQDEDLDNGEGQEMKAIQTAEN